MAGIVIPTIKRNKAQIQKFGAKAVRIPPTTSMVKQMKKDGFLPTLIVIFFYLISAFIDE